MNQGEVSGSLPFGAAPRSGGVHFRVWVPEQKSVSVVSKERSWRLEAEENGYFSALIREISPGDRYRYRLSDGEYPDPASRFQPEGPHGPSQVIDPDAFRWTDRGWTGIPLEQAVIYELHIGTFTPEGTWKSAAAQLPALRDTGINVLEVMPVSDFSGRFGWGYDGVNLYAPTRLYGVPDDMRAFVDAAHSLGIAVILDVVYNHLGADGNYLSKFSPRYFSEKHTTDWGDAINFDGSGCTAVREYYVANAAYWIGEFHLDGLRLDATQNIYDDSEPHILSEIASAVRGAAPDRTTLLIGENEPQHTILLRDPAKGGYGLDSLWNDDFHHSAIVAMTGHNDSYYTDYLGRPQEFVSAAKYGYLFQGQRYKWQKQRRGTSSFGLQPSAFVTFIQNHDQIANSARGDRVDKQTTPGLLKVFTTLILLGPGTPMLFQGQEFASSSKFYFFADVPDGLASLVRKGRQEFMAQWRTIRSSDMVRCLQDPVSEETFLRCKLDFSEREKHRAIYDLHVDLLRMRRGDPVLNVWRAGKYDGAILGEHAFLLRAFSEEHGDRLLIFNLGLDLHLNPAPEPLLAPPEGSEWKMILTTEDPRYGGCGTAPLDTSDNWRIPGHAAVVLRPAPRKAGTEKESDSIEQDDKDQEDERK